MPNKKQKKSVLDLEVIIGNISLDQKAVLARNLSVMLQSGLTIVEAIEVTADGSSGKLKKILDGIYKIISSGKSFAEALSRYPKVFSESFINIIRAGEASGNLEGNLTNLAEQLEKERELKSKIKGALLYPTVVLVAAFALGLAMSFLVLPKIIPLFEGLKVDLPFTTRLLISFSYLIRDYTWQILFTTIGSIIFLVWIIHQKFSRPATHWIILRLPIIGRLTYQTNLARFSRTLGTLLKSGLNIDEALEITATTIDNYYFKKALIKISSTVSKGGKLSSRLVSFPKLFPKLTTRMIKVGEKSGKLEDTLLFVAGFYEVEVDNTTKSLATAVEPILLIVIGLVVAFLALSIITPIYQITGNVKR